MGQALIATYLPPFLFKTSLFPSLKHHSFFALSNFFICFLSFMASSKLADDDLQNLVFKLQTLLPHLNRKPDNDSAVSVSATDILKETCDYIKKLQREVDDLSERLWKQLDSMGVDLEMVKDLILLS
ncbi:transcription factor PRE5-like [Benincasa hispida]|uniref:transcription factor PRE5-like n=1 Tax=Benincasa hispida TaxID=102211 RepID=UPI0018FFB66B|nr:transcription factor PRE5-like [Benincasa hispida]